MDTIIIDEETEVAFESHSDLSYEDYGSWDPYIRLFNKGNYIGDCLVWNDGDEDGRNYICLNYEVVYLDTLTKVEL